MLLINILYSQLDVLLYLLEEFIKIGEQKKMNIINY